MDQPLSDKKKKEQQPLLCSDKNATNGTHLPSGEECIYQEPSTFKNYAYDIILWILATSLSFFFREIRTRGSFKIPRQGPIIFVAAPHANQFVDPVVLMDQVRQSVDRRVSFLIAESSLNHPAIGRLAKAVQAIGVVRPQDNLKFMEGTIRIDPDDYTKVIGTGTKFLSQCKPKGLIGLPKSMGNVEIKSVESDTILFLRKEFKMNKPQVKKTLLSGTTFKYAAKVDQSKVYHKVFEHLAHNNCIGIFPEGGSHDRTDLLPLKAGVAIMALGCIDKHPDCNVQVVPCGMNYFHAHKFRSRGVVEFGDPIEIPTELVEKYRNPETNREAVKELLDSISSGLKSVTVTCEDYETLMVVQAMRRLYSTQFSGKLPISLVVELNRQLVRGYESNQQDPTLIKLRDDILTYNAHLSQYGLPDHCVETAKINFARNLGLLINRSLRILVTFVLAAPGIILFSPVFMLSKKISMDKKTAALAKSTVKIQANDVVATWKILIAMGFAPLLYIFWSVLVTYYFRHYNCNKLIVFSISYAMSVLVTYSALLVGDYGMDTLKSLRPLYLSLISPSGIKELQEERRLLTERIVDVVHSFGSWTSDFEEQIMDEEMEEKKTMELKRKMLLKRKKAKLSRAKLETPFDESGLDQENHHHTQDSDAISLVNSDNSLSNIPLFSTASGFKSESSLTPFTSNSGNVSDADVISDVDFPEKKTLVKSRVASRILEAVMKNRDKED